MKNKVLILAAILMLGASANSFAAYSTSGWSTVDATSGTWTVGSTLPLTGIKPSANVVLGYLAVTSGSPAVGITYTVGTYHPSGTFSYGTSSGDTNMFRYPVDTTNNTFHFIPAAPTTAGAGADWTAWTAAK